MRSKRGIRALTSNMNINFNLNSKHAQVTIFIIVAILIVGAILAYFFLVKPNISIPSTTGSLGIETCMKNAVQKQIPILGNQAGYNNPEFYYLLNDEKIPYICYTNQYFVPCVNQEPLLKQHFEEELKARITNEINSCYQNSLNELRQKGYTINEGTKELKVSLDLNQVVIDLNAPVVLTKDGSSKFTKFETKFDSPIYNMLMIANTIVQSESVYGDSDVNTLMLLYNDFSITSIMQEDGTKIYTIQDRESKIKFRFAIRSYALYPGYYPEQGDILQQ
ncbi:MAG: hypothetical protein Q7S33_01550 [Nanoarchaeota archaeon]|nr:hypothetical protein [Nanoarchaeota archaeon]